MSKIFSSGPPLYQNSLLKGLNDAKTPNWDILFFLFLIWWKERLLCYCASFSCYVRRNCQEMARLSYNKRNKLVKDFIYVFKLSHSFLVVYTVVAIWDFTAKMFPSVFLQPMILWKRTRYVPLKSPIKMLPEMQKKFLYF